MTKWTHIQITKEDKATIDRYKRKHKLSSTAKAAVHAIQQLTSTQNETTRAN